MSNRRRVVEEVRSFLGNNVVEESRELSERDLRGYVYDIGKKRDEIGLFLDKMKDMNKFLQDLHKIQDERITENTAYDTIIDKNADIENIIFELRELFENLDDLQYELTDILEG